MEPRFFRRSFSAHCFYFGCPHVFRQACTSVGPGISSLCLMREDGGNGPSCGVGVTRISVLFCFAGTRLGFINSAVHAHSVICTAIGLLPRGLSLQATHLPLRSSGTSAPISAFDYLSSVSVHRAWCGGLDVLFRCTRPFSWCWWCASSTPSSAPSSCRRGRCFSGWRISSTSIRCDVHTAVGCLSTMFWDSKAETVHYLPSTYACVWPEQDLPLSWRSRQGALVHRASPSSPGGSRRSLSPRARCHWLMSR